MSYEEALAYLNGLVNHEHAAHPMAIHAVKLERMRYLCQRLGEPQRRFRSVLVAGTNGKGSICALLYAMLRESALRVGLYTSPHLEHVRERIRVWSPGTGEDWIPPEALARIIEQLQPIVEEMRATMEDGAPTYFEVLTAAAFVYFSQQRVEVAVLEVGLGGRLDATNVVEQAVSVIGPIGVDHVDILGADPALIAREKVGIIKPRQTVIASSQDPVVDEVLQLACERHAVPLLRYGQDLTARVHRHDLEGLEATVTGLRGLYESLRIPLLGRHQAQNAAVAIGALESLSTTGIPHTLVSRGLARVEWPGRSEIVQDSPVVVMDGAHNSQAAAALRETLDELFGGRRIHLLIGMSSDKSVEGLGSALRGIAVSATCTKSRHPRALDPTVLAKRLAPFCRDVHVMSDAADAYTYLVNAVAPSDVLVVTGSLYLVGELRTALRKSNGKAAPLIAATS